MSKYMITDGCLYLRRDASGNFVPVKSQPLGDVWISIHALREESDKTAYVANLSSRIISIHALREESDAVFLSLFCFSVYFNPRAPGGERHNDLVS